MKKSISNQRKIMLLFFFFSTFYLSFSQNSNGSIDASGDIAFVAYHDTPDGFSFVLLDECPNGTQIRFIDEEWDGFNFATPTSEGEVLWENNTGLTLSIGTVIHIENADDNGSGISPNIGTASEVDSGFTIANGDQIYAITGTRLVPGTFLAFVGEDDSVGDTATLSGTGLTAGSTAVIISTEGYYLGTNIFNGTVVEVATTVNTASNWTSGPFTYPDEVTSNFTGSAFASTPKVWTGATDTNWNDTTNWNPNGVPTTTDDVSIPSGLTNYPTASSAVTVNSVTIESGASLIAQSTFTGTVTYNRTIDFVSGNLKGWYLMASPVVGQAYNDPYATTNGLATSGTNRGLATYTTNSDSWDYLQNTDSNAGTFNSGIGYSMKKGTSAGAVSFTGTLNTNDAGVDIVLSTAGNRFNLLGNPYTSYINSATFLNSEPAVSETKTIWVWNQTLSTDGAYEVKTLSPAFIVASGQGFFVKANVGGGAFNFAESNQSHNATDTFQRSSFDPEIKLLITDGEINQYGIIYYLENATTGFDVGYDGELFGGTSNPFAIYTHLVSDSQGINYQIQSLPNSNYENMVIPVGVNADAGKEITLSVEALNFPTDLKVFLEDKVTNTFTHLDEANVEYTVTLSETLNGIGRFYLHTSTSALSIDTVALNTVSVYKSGVSTLRIVGLPQGNTSVKIYNVLGKELMHTSFDGIVKDISLPKLATGMYIVEIQTEAGKLNKKIVLEQ